MSNARSISAAVSTALLFATPGAAAPMAPSGKWSVDFGDAHCVALRSYASPDGPVHLGIKPSPMGDVTQVSVVREGGASSSRRSPGR